MTLLYVDSDNAMGSARGDVDDGFALAALLLGSEPVAAIGSVFGNTSEEQAFANNRALSLLCGFQGRCLRGAAGPAAESEASRFLATITEPVRIVAIGPLTNVAAALEADPAVAGRIVELVVVGANPGSLGRWPPLWPFEFNLTKDRRATSTVLGREVPLTFVPLDVAKRLRVTRSDLSAMGGNVGSYLQKNAERWFLRARLLKWRRWIPLWDLVAAMYVLEPSMFPVREARVRLHGNGWIEFGDGPRPVRVVERFDRDAVWNAFVGRLRNR